MMIIIEIIVSPMVGLRVA